MNCDIKVMACVERMNNVISIKNSLNLDMTKDVFFGKGKPYWTPKRTSEATWLLEAEEGVTHRCVLQDDVEVAKNFKETIALITDMYPRAIIELVSFSKEPLKLVKESPYYEITGQFIGPALIMPLDWAREAWEWIDSINPLFWQDDVALSIWAKEKHKLIIGICPNIVQHLAPSESLCGLSDKNKTSKSYQYFNNDLSIWKKAPKSLPVYKSPLSYKTFYKERED